MQTETQPEQVQFVTDESILIPYITYTASTIQSRCAVARSVFV